MVITSTTPEIFAEKFGKLVDDVAEGQGVINDANGNLNEAESPDHWCPSGERSPVSIAKWASLELRNKYKNSLLACVPESNSRRIFQRKDYAGLHDAISMPLSAISIKTYDSDNINLSGVSRPEDMSVYLASGIDKSALPTTIDF